MVIALASLRPLTSGPPCKPGAIHGPVDPATVTVMCPVAALQQTVPYLPYRRRSNAVLHGTQDAEHLLPLSHLKGLMRKNL